MRKTYRAVALLAAALVASCGGSGGGTAGEPQAQIGGASGTELAEHQALHVGNGAELQTLDPHRAEDTSSFSVLIDIYEGLVGESPGGDLIPGVASAWTISDDGKTYVFNLRPEARWSKHSGTQTSVGISQ